MTTNGSEPTAAQNALGDLAPKLVELTDEVLFGDVWERTQLSKRDRSLMTCAALVALGKTEQMDFHFPKALENGVTPDELIELITHLAFYASLAKRDECRAAREGAVQEVNAEPAHLQVIRAGSQPESAGARANFTRDVVITPPVQLAPHTRAAGASVAFEPPGTRTGELDKWKEQCRRALRGLRCQRPHDVVQLQTRERRRIARVRQRRATWRTTGDREDEA